MNLGQRSMFKLVKTSSPFIIMRVFIILLYVIHFLINYVLVIIRFFVFKFEMYFVFISRPSTHSAFDFLISIFLSLLHLVVIVLLLYDCPAYNSLVLLLYHTYFVIIDMPWTGTVRQLSLHTVTWIPILHFAPTRYYTLRMSGLCDFHIYFKTPYLSQISSITRHVQFHITQITPINYGDDVYNIAVVIKPVRNKINDFILSNYVVICYML